MSTQHCKIIIIGGGPAGLTAAIYTARANLNPLVFAGSLEGTLMPGGQLMTTTEIENFPGAGKVQGSELIGVMIDQATLFGAKIINEWVKSVDLSVYPFKLVVSDQEWTADAIIIATGAQAKWLNAPGEKNFINKGISACATCDGPLKIFRGKHIIVVGGGDSACEEALFLIKFASRVTIIHRRNELRASRVMVDRVLAQPYINILWNTVITGYFGNDFLEGVYVENIETGEKNQIQAEGVFMAIGHSPASDLFKGQINLDSEGYIITRENVYTSVEGVFACGDVHDKMYRQAITASGFGCQAGIAVERWLGM